MPEEPPMRFIDGDSEGSYFGKDKITFRDIILNHLRKISLLACVEFTGGYWESRPNPNPQISTVTKVYVSDAREVYSNAVECFGDMLYAYFDNEMSTAYKRIKEDTIIKYKLCTLDGEYGRKFLNEELKLLYSISRLEFNKTLFRELCSFLYRKKYLEIGELED